MWDQNFFFFFLWQVLTGKDNSFFFKPLLQEKAAHNEAGYFLNSVRFSSFNSRQAAKMYTWSK